jgi:hypothetical protein
MDTIFQDRWAIRGVAATVDEIVEDGAVGEPGRFRGAELWRLRRDADDASTCAYLA